MDDISKTACCVVDHGQFIHIARAVAREFKQVYYFAPWDNGMPSVRDTYIGEGYPEIIRVGSPLDVVDECRLFAFPDVGFEAEQRHLKRLGKLVWGAGGGDRLEIKRGRFIKALKEVGMPVPKYKKIKGMTALRTYLKDHNDVIIKISVHRGDMETHQWKNWRNDEGWLDQQTARFGPVKEGIIFFVFEKIESNIEDAIEGYSVDGKWPNTIIHGMENKDRSYIGAFQKFSDSPQETRIANERFSPLLARLKYRGFFGTEVRITDEGESYFIDATCRCSSPPSQMMCLMVENLGEIMLHGAAGELMEMVPAKASEFGVQAAAWINRSEWTSFEYPEELGLSLATPFSFINNGRVCVPPHEYRKDEAVWVSATGSTISWAIQNLIQKVELVKDSLDVQVDSLAELLKQAQEAEEKGLEFTNQEIPEPSEVLT